MTTIHSPPNGTSAIKHGDPITYQTPEKTGGLRPIHPTTCSVRPDRPATAATPSVMTSTPNRSPSGTSVANAATVQAASTLPIPLVEISSIRHWTISPRMTLVLLATPRDNLFLNKSKERLTTGPLVIARVSASQTTGSSKITHWGRLLSLILLTGPLTKTGCRATTLYRA